MFVYIHIPFCDSKCHYCAFNSFTQNHHLKEHYMQALLKQLEFELKRFNLKKIETIFIGGGTPSTIDAKLYIPIFNTLSHLLTKNCEITFEANPNSAKKKWLQEIKALGANRVSFGVQSFDEKKLKFLGRSHNPNDAIEAVEDAKEAGFNHISIDIIYDTALDSFKLLQKDIDIALSLPIDHISTYSLILEENTPFANRKELKKDQEDFDYFLKSIIPFPQYEVSNYGLYRSKHNLAYWKLQDYIGVGCGAVGFLKNRRFYPTTNLQEYIQNPLQITQETLSQKDLRTEKIFLGLRSCVGVKKNLLDPNKVSILLQENKITENKTKIYNKNYFLADEIALFLI